MKRIIPFLVIFNCISIFAQREIQPEFGALLYTSQKGYYDSKKTNQNSNKELILSNNSYYGFKINIGSRFILRKKSISLNFQYQYLENNGAGFKGNRISLKSNLIGIGGSLRLLELNRVRLFFQTAFLTEISTNYMNNYLVNRYFTPADYLPYQLEDGYVFTNLYKGTPLITNFSIGCNVKIVSGLSFDATFGYGIRLLRSQHAILNPNSNTPKGHVQVQSINSPYLVPFHMLDFQAGLSYTFSMKKKTKLDGL
ncbi:MAG: hypothetical protein PHQ74_10495 [Crocinitomicaceae bacterium]|nr:hypothetical protein [Crocinitomicaceae bacterium]